MNISKISLSIIGLFFVTLISGCSEDDDDSFNSSPSSYCGSERHETPNFSAEVNSVFKVAECAYWTESNFQGGTISITINTYYKYGTDSNGISIFIAIPDFEGIGISEVQEIRINNTTYFDFLLNEVNINKYTSTELSGTFNFIAPDVNDTLRILNGSFQNLKK